MSKELKQSVTYSTSSFQSFDGSNYTLTGLEGKLQKGRYSVSAFAGAGTDFEKFTAVSDIKAGMNYDKNGIFNQNLRLRKKINNDTNTFQIRYSPISLNAPVGKNTSLYINPHYCGQKDMSDNKWTNSIGAFAGVTQKFNKTSVSLEAQRYNLQDIKDNSGKNWSINAVISYKF